VASQSGGAFARMSGRSTGRSASCRREAAPSAIGGCLPRPAVRPIVQAMVAMVMVTAMAIGRVATTGLGEASFCARGLVLCLRAKRWPVHTDAAVLAIGVPRRSRGRFAPGSSWREFILGRSDRWSPVKNLSQVALGSEVGGLSAMIHDRVPHLHATNGSRCASEIPTKSRWLRSCFRRA
jgi:hypothetical protein